MDEMSSPSSLLQKEQGEELDHLDFLQGVGTRTMSRMGAALEDGDKGAVASIAQEKTFQGFLAMAPQSFRREFNQSLEDKDFDKTKNLFNGVVSSVKREPSLLSGRKEPEGDPTRTMSRMGAALEDGDKGAVASIAQEKTFQGFLAMAPQSFRREFNQSLEDKDFDKTKNLFNGVMSSGERRANILNSIDRLRGGGEPQVGDREAQGKESAPLLRPTSLDGASRQPVRHFGGQDQQAI
jgi:hypothetical protein